MAAAQTAPEINFGFVDPAEPNPMFSLIFILLVILLASMVIVFIKNMVTKRDAIAESPKHFTFWTSYFSVAAKCSILLGLVASLISIYQALIKIGIAGFFSIDYVAGPIGESLIFTAFGFMNAAVGIFLAFLCRWKLMRMLSK